MLGSYAHLSFEELRMQESSSPIITTDWEARNLSDYGRPSLEEQRMEHYRKCERFPVPTFGVPTSAYVIVPSSEGGIPGYEIWGKVVGELSEQESPEDSDDDDESEQSDTNDEVQQPLDDKPSAEDLTEKVHRLEEMMCHLMSKLDV
ncbi:hypothetical protein FA95DRAFT_1601997 [Auriscalpium vulgare]|uniref:Uncharacterized protein n=1 Tax=Auriscalpium vulgare TaxID=40419 RepID=A0ACB8S889_9AGAM|nr:hypothetical protein FA95DRAFT_1601997 [Auriscalpium vulgare]